MRSVDDQTVVGHGRRLAERRDGKGQKTGSDEAAKERRHGEAPLGWEASSVP
jgi:hypothetical protein